MKVSICIATHNSSNTIRYTLNSILNQTYQDFEVILVDDYSTDDTVNILNNEYCSKDNRFKLYVNTTDFNHPYIDAFNKSYDFASGDLLFRIDHDDILLPDHLEYIASYMDSHPEVDACCTRLIFYDLGNEDDYSKIDINDIPAEKFEENYIENFNKWMLRYDVCPPGINHLASYTDCVILTHNPSSCIRRESLEKYHLTCKFYIGGDTMFWRELIAFGGTFKILPHHTLAYILHKSNTHTSFSLPEQVTGDDINYYIMSNLYMYYVACYTYFGLQHYPGNLLIIDDTTVDDLKEVIFNTLEHFENELIKENNYRLLPDSMKL